MLMILSAGCGSYGTVSGKVMMKDEPLHSGMVTFITPDRKWTRTSGIGEDGSYTIEKAPIGPMKISIFSSGPTPRSQIKFKERMPGPEVAQGEDLPPRARRRINMGKGTSAATAPKGPAVPKKYNDPDTSELTYEVKPGAQEHNIELK
jgi:hypothetical protein